MSKTLTILGLELKLSLRDRGVLFVLFVMPIMFAMILGVITGGATTSAAVPVRIVVQDDSPAARFVADRLAAEAGLNLSEVSLDEAKRAVGRREATAAVIIPAGFGAAVEAAGTATSGAGTTGTTTGAAGGVSSPATIQIVTLPGSAEAAAISQLVEGASDRLVSGLAAAATVERVTGVADEAAAQTVFADVQTRWQDGAPVTVDETAATTAETLAERSDRLARENQTHIILGMTVMFLMISMNMGMSGILQGKKEGTWQRLMVAPTSRGAVLGGKLASLTVLAWVQVVVLMAFGKMVFGLDWGSAPLAFALLITAFILAANGLGLILASVAKTPAQLNAVAPIIITATSMLGGCFWPAEAMPSSMQLVAKFLPQSWAMSGLGDIALAGAGLADVLIPLAVLIGFAVLFFSVGLWRVACTEQA